MRHRLLVILLSILFVACESYDCTLNNYVGMYGAFDRNGVAVSIQDTLTITAGKAGPVLLNRSVNTSKLNLPLSYWQDEDTLVFHIKGKDQANEDYLIQDTVWIKKSNQVHFESPDCPATLFHTIEEVRSTNEIIKSITVVRSSVNYELTTNLQIHLF